jgi:hypothetical protein
MYENIIEKTKGSFYYDTDSAKMLNPDYLIWREKYANGLIPHWREVEKYEPKYKTQPIHDYVNHTKIYGAFDDEYRKIAKDMKRAYFDGKKQYAIIMKDMNKSIIKFKGLCISSDPDTKTITRNDVRVYPDQTINNKYEYYEKHKSIVNDYDEIFKTLNKGGPVIFLCSNWTRNTNDNDNKIEYHNRLKIIGGTVDDETERDDAKTLKKESALFKNDRDVYKTKAKINRLKQNNLNNVKLVGLKKEVLKKHYDMEVEEFEEKTKTEDE